MGGRTFGLPVVKITPDDMVRIRYAFFADYAVYPNGPTREDRRDIAVATLLTGIYDRGYERGWEDGRQGVDPA